MPGPDKATEKRAVAEFTGVTQSDKSTATKFLKQSNWNVSAAVNAFFQNPNNSSSSIRPAMNKVFDKFRDDPKNEPDEINVEGTGKLLSELGIGLEDIGALVFSELVDSPSLGKVTREGFISGCSDVGADSLPKLRNTVLARKSQLSSNRETFRAIYNHTFVLGLQNNQKSLLLEIATEFWSLVLGPSGYEWRAQSTPWLEWWLEYMQEKWKKAVNRDLWRQTLTFAEQTMKDESLGFWNEESSWPSVIDDFVAWVRKEKRPGGAGQGAGEGDAMEVE